MQLRSPGIEVATFPILYPQPSFGKTDARERRTCLSYAQDAKLMFLLHDIHMAKQIMTKLTVGQSRIFSAGGHAREVVPRKY